MYRGEEWYILKRDKIPLGKGEELHMTRILLVEDDAAIARGLCYALKQEGFSMRRVSTLADALAALKEPADLLLLDLSLPDGSGLEVCRQARRQGDLPINILSARDDETTMVLGLDMGADDYIAKPFRIRELQSRIRAVLRRRGGAAASFAVLPGGVRVDLQKAEVTREGQPVALSAVEYKLLLAFVSHPGQVLSRSQLLAGIWDAEGNYVNDNTLSVYVRRLRGKLEAPGGPAIIATVRGLGYRLEVE